MVKKAVALQPKCNFSMDSYEEFLLASAHYVPENKASIIYIGFIKRFVSANSFWNLMSNPDGPILK